MPKEYHNLKHDYKQRYSVRQDLSLSNPFTEYFTPVKNKINFPQSLAQCPSVLPLLDSNIEIKIPSQTKDRSPNTGI